MTIAVETSKRQGAPPPGAAGGTSERGRSARLVAGIIGFGLLVLVGISLYPYLKARRGRLGLVPEPVDRPDIDLTNVEAPIDLGLLGSTAARP